MSEPNVYVVGLACRMPESGSAAELWRNLIEARDMVTADERRWPLGHAGLPHRSGKLPALDRFDAAFFRVHGSQARRMEPQLRLLLEVSWEALIDAHLDPAELRDSDTGVYIGATQADANVAWARDESAITGYENTGSAGSMFANRLSFFYDIHGPSKCVDTACSSSLVAFDDAVRDLRSGRCQMALVGGTNTTLWAAAGIGFNRLNMLSADGACRSFDAGANGYVRSEGVGVLVLTTDPALAAHAYATVLATGTNSDGYTEQGITYPSAEQQMALSRAACKAAGIDPSTVSYVEAHGTGTLAGDGQELKAVAGVYGHNRTADAPLWVGSVKSNLGHCEGASGIAGLIKVLLAFEHGVLPPNLHFAEPNPSSEALTRGLLQVPVEPLEWAGGRAAISSFGFGGTNAVAILEGTPRASSHDPTAKEPVAISWSRTRVGSELLLSRAEHVVPFTKPARDVRRFPWRSALIEGAPTTTQVEKSPALVVFAMSGLGGEWATMGAHLIAQYPEFEEVVRTCDAALDDVDVVALLSDGAARFDDPGERTVALTVMQLGITAIVHSWGLRPDAYLGYSAGELCCAVLDGVMTHSQATRAAWSRGRAASTVDGRMVVTELSVDAANQLLSDVPGCVVAGVNAPGHTTLSGPTDALTTVVQRLQREQVYAKFVGGVQSPYHGPAMHGAQELWETALQGTEPVQRTPRWIWSRAHAPSHVDGRVLAAGLTQAVAWSDALAELPEGALLIEIGPSNRLESVIRQARPDLEYLSMMGPERSIEHGIADLWLAGVHLDRGQARPPRAVRELQTAWDHRESHPVPTWRDFLGGEIPGVESTRITLNLTGADRHILDHDIDGRILVPGVAYLVAAWRAIAQRAGIAQDQCPVTLRDVTFHQAVQVPNGVDEIALDVIVLPDGAWSVLRAGELVADGDSEVRATSSLSIASASAPDATPPLQIRDASTEDIEALVELERLGQPPGMRTSRGEIAARIDKGSCWVACDDTGSLRGAVYAQRIRDVDALQTQTRGSVGALFEPEGDVLQLIELIAVPEAREERVGERLLHHVREFVAEAPSLDHIVAVTRCRQWPRRRGTVAYEDYVASGEDTGPDLHLGGGARIARVLHDWWPEDVDNDGHGVLVIYDDTNTASEVQPPSPGELTAFLRRGVARVSPCLDASASLDPSATWADLGLDSMAMIAFRAWLQRSFRVPLHSDLLFRCPTLGDLQAALEPHTCREEARNSVDWLTADEVYASLVRRGYRYGPSFRSIRSVRADGKRATVGWEGQWVPFLDGIFQAALVRESNSPHLVVPVGLRSFRIDPPGPSIGDEVEVEMDFDRAVAGCAFATFDGYRFRSLARAPAETLEPVMLVSRFTPYGDTSSSDERACAYVREQEASMAQWLGPALPAHFDAHPHLRRVHALVQRARPGVSPLRDELLAAPDGIMLRVARDLVGSPQQLALTLQAPLQAINQHPEHGQLYAEDLLARGFEAGVLDRMMGIVEENTSTSLQICEIGAGTGGLTRQIVHRPSLAGIERYVATDVTSAFVPEMERHLDGHAVEHARWDLNDKIPAELGTFDLIVASNALHVAQDLTAALRHVREGLRDGGFVCFFEATNLVTALLWGLGEACWQFTDEREFGLWTSVAHWKQLLAEAGLELVTTHKAVGDHAAMFLARKPATVRPAALVQVPDHTVDAVRVERWLRESKAALREQTDASVWLTGSRAVTGLARCVRREPDGHRVRTLASLDGSTTIPRAQILDADLVHNVLDGDVWGRIHEQRQPLPTPTARVRQWASLSMQAGEAQLQWQALPDPREDQVDVRPTVVGLNFRDVVLASGRMRAEEFALPQYVLDGVAGFGIEFVGLDPQGDRVIGTAPGALATHINAPKQLLLHGVPDHWSDAEAVTVPVAYATVYYALDMRARIRPGDTVLVHSGAGGLGLATLHVLLARGHEVFTTCGTEAKRTFLKARFPQLDDAHIGNSRTSGFEKLIKKQTGGRGVDIVVNALSGALAEEGLRCVAPYGCFVEVGKYDMVSGGHLSMAPLMRNVTVAAVDLSQALDQPEVAVEIIERVARGMADGEVVPLPVTTYGVDDVGTAIRKMGRGEHIGKLVIEMDRASAEVPLPLSCKPGSSWLITGGLGGVGLELCQWLAVRGVTRLVLSSRRGMRTATQSRCVRTLRSRGIQVEISTLNAADAGEAAKLVHLANAHNAPLQGVLHLAMVLEDRLLPEHDADSWLTAVRPKSHAATHLDAATRDLPSVEYFVCFSSVAATFGNPGQGNYAYANMAMEQICADREAAGLHALAVRWGPIADVGWVSDQNNQLGRDISRMAYQPIESCLSCLERVMVSDTRGTVTIFAERTESPRDDKASSAVGAQSLLSSVLRILGGQEDQMHEQATLADCGIDSLQIVEVQATLHRHTGQTISFADIQRLTIGELRAKAGERAPGKLPMAAPSQPMAGGPIIERTELVPAQPQRVIYLVAGFATDPSEVASGLPLILVRWERAATLERLCSALEADLARLPPETSVEVWSHSIGVKLVDWLHTHSAKLRSRLDRWVALSPPSATYANAFLDELSLEELRSLDLEATREQFEALPFFLTRHERTPLSVPAVRHQAVLAREAGEDFTQVEHRADLVVLPVDDVVALDEADAPGVGRQTLRVPGDHELVSLGASTWRTIDRHGAASIVETNVRHVLLFPGQGSQHVGMGQGLFERYPEIAQRASHQLRYDLAQLCLEDPDGKLDDTRYTQPALYVVNALHHRAYVDRGGAAPDAVAGHSLGEFNALVAAGRLDFDAGLRLVQRRGELMANVPDGAMAAVIGIDAPTIRRALDTAGLDTLDLANHNAPDQVVISGSCADIVASEAPLRASGAKWVRLRVSGAFHSRFMKPVGEAFARAIAKEDLRPSNVPVFSNATGLAYGNNVAELLIRQMHEPVLWAEIIAALEQGGDCTFIELGPGKTLTRLLERRHRPRAVASPPGRSLPRRADERTNERSARS